MSRRRKQFKREVTADPIFEDTIITKFVNSLMLDGKKSKAQKIFYSSLDRLKEKIPGEKPIFVFRKALDNCKPSLEVRSRRVGGATYQVPVDVRPVRRTTLAMRWLVENARKRGEKTMADCLSAEFMDAFHGRGNSIKKKEDVHRMAEANKAFSHYNW